VPWRGLHSTTWAWWLPCVGGEVHRLKQASELIMQELVAGCLVLQVMPNR